MGKEINALRLRWAVQGAPWPAGQGMIYLSSIICSDPIMLAWRDDQRSGAAKFGCRGIVQPEDAEWPGENDASVRNKRRVGVLGVVNK